MQRSGLTPFDSGSLESYASTRHLALYFTHSSHLRRNLIGRLLPRKPAPRWVCSVDQPCVVGLALDDDVLIGVAQMRVQTDKLFAWEPIQSARDRVQQTLEGVCGLLFERRDGCAVKVTDGPGGSSDSGKRDKSSPLSKRLSASELRNIARMSSSTTCTLCVLCAMFLASVDAARAICLSSLASTFSFQPIFLVCFSFFALSVLLILLLSSICFLVRRSEKINNASLARRVQCCERLCDFILRVDSRAHTGRLNANQTVGCFFLIARHQSRHESPLHFPSISKKTSQGERKQKTMTKYWGGKTKIGKQVADAMREHADQIGFVPRFYWEPFLGMGGVMRHMAPALQSETDCYGTDNNPGLIRFWQHVQSGGTFPGHLSLSKLEHLKDTRDQASALHIFVGHSCGFHGQYFSGRLKQPQADEALQAALRSLDKIVPAMSQVDVRHADFFQTRPPHGGRGGIIYCDPPYVERAKKSNTVWNKFQNQGFDCAAFWRRVTDWSRHNLVFVSETTAPPDWAVVWARQWSNNQGPYAYKRNELLFVHRSWLHS